MSRHSVSFLFAHIVFVTKYRRKVLTKSIIEDIRNIFTSACDGYNAKILEFEGESDHVHLLIQFTPSVRLCDLIRTLKTQTSSFVMKKYKDHIVTYLWKDSLWTPSYFISTCGGAPLEIIKNYIQNQESPRT